MLLSDTSIKRPVFATVIGLLLIAIGAVSFTRLALREYPDIDPPIVSVRTTYQGASANVVESRITEVIEDRIVGFDKGVPVSIDGRRVSVLEAIVELNSRAGEQGVGRLDVVEDGLVGIKSREIYEAPGAMVLITAHTELEHVTLERELGRFKRTTDQKWGELVYDGLWYSPLKRALESFVAHTQEHVTGEIRLVLHGGHIAVNGRRSAESLYDFNLATYDEGDSFDQSSAKGFVHVHGLSSKISAQRDLGSR